MKTKFLIFLSLALCAISTSAAERSVQTLNTAAFLSLNPETMNPGVVYYSQDIVPFASWNPNEREVLSLYPSYKEPTLWIKKAGVKKQIVEHIEAFITRDKAVVNKSPAQVNLASFLNFDNIRQLDPEIFYQRIGPAQFMYNTVGHGPVNNFKWCNEIKRQELVKAGGNPAPADYNYIFRPQREFDLSHLAPQGRSWCDRADRTLCVESCFLFGKAWGDGVAGANAFIAADDEKKDYGVAFQAEVRYLTSEAEYGNRVPLSLLTGVHTPVRGIVELNMFYFNQVIQFGKVVAVFQEHPKNANQMIVTSLNVIGVKKRTWDSYGGMVAQVLKGNLMNTGTGLTAGVPVFTQNISKSIIKILEK